MKTIDRLEIHALPARVWQLATQVEAWPTHLAHYRWVTRREGSAGSDGVVEMAAWRPFGPLRWPTWWCSTMALDERKGEIRYCHVAGVTRKMDVIWRIEPTPAGYSDVTIIHTWDGPEWPLIGALAARLIIGPVFVHGIASRTLAGLAAVAEQS